MKFDRTRVQSTRIRTSDISKRFRFTYIYFTGSQKLTAIFTDFIFIYIQYDYIIEYLIYGLHIYIKYKENILLFRASKTIWNILTIEERNLENTR